MLKNIGDNVNNYIILHVIFFTIHYNTLQYNTIHYNTIHYNTISYYIYKLDFIYAFHWVAFIKKKLIY